MKFTSLMKYAMLLLIVLALVMPVFGQVNIEQPIRPDTLSSVRQLLNVKATSIYNPGTFGTVVDSVALDSTIFYELWTDNTLILNIKCDSAIVIRMGGLAINKNQYYAQPVDTLVIQNASQVWQIKFWNFTSSGMKHAYFKFETTGLGDSIRVNDSYIYRSRY